MYLVTWTSLIGTTGITMVRGARVYESAYELKKFSKLLWDSGFETVWFKWEDNAASDLTNEEFLSIDNILIN